MRPRKSTMSHLNRKVRRALREQARMIVDLDLNAVFAATEQHVPTGEQSFPPAVLVISGGPNSGVDCEE